MEEVKISFKTAKLAKEKGFKFKTKKKKIGVRESDLGTLFNTILYKKVNVNPTQSLLQRWLRETHNIHVEILWREDNTYSGQLISDVHFNNEVSDQYEAWGCNSYENALEICLSDALNLIEKDENR